jgi:hypothetical protein
MIAHRLVRRRLLLATLVLAGLAGCTMYRKMMGEDTVSLEGADVERMEVDIRRAAKTICPREPVQLWIAVDAKLADQKTVSRLETWVGDRSARRNGMLDFGNFTFASGQGTVDEFGWFQPNGDMLATVERGFEIRTALRFRPEQFTESRSYPPDYSCVQTVGGIGQAGHAGSDGSAGSDGGRGSGWSGGWGSSGQSGASGQSGPRLQVSASYVRTRYFDRLMAIRIEGGVRDFVLAPAGQEVLVMARGGPGGPGGAGGRGGNGGDGSEGRPGQEGGRGGQGGDGGDGGDGGAGGFIELIYDNRFPDLARWIKLDPSGGPGGAGGERGAGGSGGSGGKGLSGARSGKPGRGGSSGDSGDAGRPGSPGTVQIRAGVVTSAFRNLPGIRPF